MNINTSLEAFINSYLCDRQGYRERKEDFPTIASLHHWPQLTRPARPKPGAPIQVQGSKLWESSGPFPGTLAGKYTWNTGAET